MPSVFSENHYKYLNEKLNMADAEKLEPSKVITEEAMSALKVKARKAFDEMIEDDQRKKMAQAMSMLENEAERKQYDDALAAKPSMELTAGGKKGAIPLIPLAPVEQIISAFDDFKKSELGKKDAQGGPLYAESDFKYEKKGNVHVFTFPNEESANQFMQHLFNKNLAMLPGGSQDINDVKQYRQNASPLEPVSSTKGTAASISSTLPKDSIDNPAVENGVENPLLQNRGPSK